MILRVVLITYFIIITQVSNRNQVSPKVVGVSQR